MKNNSNSKIKLELFNELLFFIKNNFVSVLIILFFALFAYGYYLTTWAISIDSEVGTFPTGNSHLIWFVRLGRPILAAIALLLDLKVLPYFNDLLSILLIVISAIIWLINISNIKSKLARKGIIGFALLYVVSPIYLFQLRFTNQNIAIGLGFLFISISSFYLVKIFTSILCNLPIKKAALFYGAIYLFLATGIYQMFITYFITCILFMITLYLANNNNTLSKVMIVKYLIYSTLFLIISAGLYKITCIATYHFIPQSNYTDSYISWGKYPFFTVINNIYNYFLTILNYRFNIVMTLTLIVSVFFIAINIYKRFLLVVFFILLIISTFILPISLGSSMPLRTMQVIPLVIASIWTVISASLTKNSYKNIVATTILILSLINAQYVTQISYADNMRLEYDKNFANQLYSYVISNTRDAIDQKPLVILGKHSYPDRPFALKSRYDTIGFSFFDWDNGNYLRMYLFMKWLGNDYIKPTSSEQESAKQLSFDMPSYPAKGALKETKSLIILKLSSANIGVDQNPINLNLQHYSKFSVTSILYNVDSLTIKNNQLSYWGWAYIKQFDAAKTQIFIKFANSNDNYIFPVTLSEREDIADLYKNGQNLRNSGFYGILNNKMKHAHYKVFLILTNGNSYAEVDSKKAVDL